ncbi:MAG: ADP-ribose-binding protein [Desulfuromonas sp.]|nr:MAG: ADP-ribose-binding protein [Desulfuromonas sp.]
MIEYCGDMWSFLDQAIIAITTGGSVSRSGRCAMPRGCAAQARERFAGLDEQLGALIRQGGNHVYLLDHGLVSFPVEHTPYEVPSLALIEQSCCELLELTNANGWSCVVVPRPGCGGGGLSWKDVRPILERYFDDRFTIISIEQ